VEELSKVHELAYYLIDAHTSASSDRVSLHFTHSNQYLLALLDEGVIQLRNYRDHAVLREVATGLQQLTTMVCSPQEPHRYYLGDALGQLHILSDNGLRLDSAKVLQSPIGGLQLWQHRGKARILAYGGNCVVIVAHLPL
jgi:hypothetical protein